MVVEIFESNSPLPQTAELFDDRRLPELDNSQELNSLIALVDRLQREVNRLDAQRDQLLEEATQLREQVAEAADIQRQLLPDDEVFAGLDVRTLYQPLNGVGGDVFMADRLADDSLAISLADVSGHGIAAGMLTPLLRQALSMHTGSKERANAPSSEDLFQRANRELLALGLSDGHFATALHTRYEPATRTLTFARAGHCHPVLLRDGEAPRMLKCAGTLLGAIDDLAFPTSEVTLRPGDRVVLHTDGLEALISDSESSAYPVPLAETAWFAQLSDMSADDIVADVSRRLERAAWRAADADDVTVVVLTVR